MSFTRTPSGLRNIRLFLRVEKVVFTEGGSTQYTASEALAGSCNIRSFDAPFWGVVIKSVMPSAHVAIKAVGSKSTLLDIMAKVSSNAIPSVLVAADRDFEGQVKKENRFPCYMCSWGYSWENCFYTRESVTSLLLSHFVHDPRIAEQVSARAAQSWGKFKKNACRLAKLDAMVSVIVGMGFFDRQKEGRDMFVGSSSKLSVKNIARRRKFIRAQHPGVKFSKSPNIRNPWRFCYGKLIAAFGRRLIRELLDVKYSDEIIDRMLIVFCLSDFRAISSSHSFAYYSRKIPIWMSD